MRLGLAGMGIVFLVSCASGENKSDPKPDSKPRSDSDARENAKSAEARTRAKPHYDVGRRCLEEATLDRYRPGADLGAMRQRLEKAVAEFTRAVEECADFSEAYLGRGDAETMLFRPDRAERDYSRAIQCQPQPSAAFIARGKLYLARFMEFVLATEWKTIEAERDEVRVWREKAVADFTAAHALKTLGEEAEILQASLLYSEGKYRGSIELLTKLIDSGSKMEEVFRLRADAYWALSQREAQDRVDNLRKASESYDEAIRLCPNYYEAHRYRGAMLFMIGKTEEAFQDLSAALKLNPDDSFALSDMGTYHQKTGHDDLAMEFYAKAIAANVRNFRAWTNRGVIKVTRKDYASALEDFQEALKANPRHVPARYNTAVAHFYRGEESKALDELNALIEENFQFAQGHFTVGTIHYSRGRWKPALEAFEAAGRADPNFAGKSKTYIDECRRKLGE